MASLRSRRCLLAAAALCMSWAGAVIVLIWKTDEYMGLDRPSGEGSALRRAPAKRIQEYWISIDGASDGGTQSPDAVAPDVAPLRRPAPPLRGGGSTSGSERYINAPKLFPDGSLSATDAESGGCTEAAQRCGNDSCARFAFGDLDSPPNEPGCFEAAVNGSAPEDLYTLTVIIVLRNELNSVPVQTFLSARAFTSASVLRKIVFAYAAGGAVGDRWLGVLSELLRAHTDGCAYDVVAGYDRFESVLSAIRRASTRYIAVVDDSVVFADGWAEPLLKAVAARPDIIAVPHVDSLLPNLVYTNHYSKQAYREWLSSVWSVAWSLTYREQAVRRLGVGELRRSAALAGDAFVAARTFLLDLADRMVVRSTAELGYLAWTCGGGVLLVGCSSIQKTDNYYHSASYDDDNQRERFASAYLARYYPLYEAGRGRRGMRRAPNATASPGSSGCKNFHWYAKEIATLPFTDLSEMDIQRIDRVGRVMSLYSGRCYSFGRKDSGDAIRAVEQDNCLTAEATILYVERNSGGLLQMSDDGSWISSKVEGEIQIQRRDNFTSTSRGFHLVRGGLITNGQRCLVRREIGREGAAVAIAENCTGSTSAGRDFDPSWTWAIVP